MRAIIEKYAAMPFTYGQDCCQFAGECVETITGQNPMAQFTYRDEQTANKIINSYGSLEAAMLDVLGPASISSVKDGDVCLLELEGQQLAGITYGGRVVYRTPKTGLCDLPLNRVTRFWCT